MYAYIKGTLEETGEDYIVVEAGGIGYQIFTTGQTFQYLPSMGEEVKVYTYLHVREDAMILFGFLTKDDLFVFRLLLGVSGIGPKGALAVLSVMTTDDLRFAVLGDDAKAIAKAYGVKLIEVLTGFKYIGEQIKFFKQQNTYEYVFGLEESYGCLAGTYARDKDACVAVMMLCEVAAWCKSNGITLWDAMVSLYETYGYYKEGLETMTLKGMDGAEKIQSMMNEMRSNPPKKIGAWDVLALRDYKKDTRTEIASDKVTPTGLPESNVLYYELSDNAWCCVRPSGTEPKIKFYFGVVGADIKDSEKKLDELRTAMLAYAGE